MSILKLQTNLSLPSITDIDVVIIIITWHMHSDTVCINLHNGQAFNVHQLLSQQAQAKLTVDGDRHSVLRVIEGAVLVVAIPVHTVQCKLQHGVLSAALGVALTLLVHILVDVTELL